MKTPRLYTLFALLLMCIPIIAQEHALVQGYCKDENNKPVENVNISIVNTQYGTRTFQLSNKRPLTIATGKNYFANQFLTDEATGKIYGLFVQNGINYLGCYDPTKGTVGMGQKASNNIYPRAFKVHNGYAYSVYFDNARMWGKINRVKLNN